MFLDLGPVLFLGLALFHPLAKNSIYIPFLN